MISILSPAFKKALGNGKVRPGEQRKCFSEGRRIANFTELSAWHWIALLRAKRLLTLEKVRPGFCRIISDCSNHVERRKVQKPCTLDHQYARSLAYISILSQGLKKAVAIGKVRSGEHLKVLF